MGENVSSTKARVWPKSPYRGLDSYGPEEAMLFAGRDRDADACAQLLASSTTRILLLHGTTGSGKSSLIRAGLIPILDNADAGFQFLREEEADPNRVLFVRSTDAPLNTLADALYSFASRKVDIKTARGPRSIDLSPALLGCDSVDAFRQDVGASHSRMLASIRQLGKSLPYTLVLIVDQGEEVLTLMPGSEGNAARDEYFRFIAAFSRAELDVKLLVALRTEYYGRFRHEFQKRVADVTNIRDYYLGDLERADLLEVITRPTEREPNGELGSPFDHYRFDFEPGLPERIVDDLLQTTPAGGVLPALQIVCTRLYQQPWRATSQGAPERIITSAAYEELGGIEGQISSHIDAELDSACREFGTDSDRISAERDAWKRVLSLLVRPQADGTVTTDMKRSSDLAKQAETSRCKVPFEAMMAALCGEKRRLCRRVEVQRKGLVGSSVSESMQRLDSGAENVVCFTLAHEALGPSLVKWSTLDPRDLLSAEVRAAAALVNRGFQLDEQGRSEEEIAVYDEVARRYGDRAEVALAELVASALFNKGVCLGALDRSEEEIAVYDEVARRYGDRAELTLAELVAKALVNKGVCLGALGRSKEEVAVYDDLLKRFGARDELALAEPVAKALVNKGVCLGALDRSEEAVAVYNDLLTRFGARDELALSKQVARALFNKGVRLGALGRSKEEVAVYDDLLKRFGARDELALAEQVAKALFNKGVCLGALGRSKEEVAVYDDLLTRFGARDELALAKLVAKALNGLGFTLLCNAKLEWQQGDEQEARAMLLAAENKFAAARARQPQNPIILGNAGYVAFLLDREEEARELLRTAIRLGGEEIRELELQDSLIHPLPRDEAFQALLRTL